MSENKNGNQDNQQTETEETAQIFSEIKNTEDYSSPEGPSSDFPEIRCPLCPKFAKITINNIKNEIISECPDNHYMKLDFLSFIEKSTDHPINSTKCSICNSTGKTNNYCLECNKYFCINCLEKHNKNDLTYNVIGRSNILLKNNSLQNNTDNGNNNIINTSFPNHLSTLNLMNSTNSVINTVQHHVININQQDNHCPIHNNEKFFAFCLKCNKSFCQKCLEEFKKGIKNNLNVLSCGKFGNINHNIKKIKDIMGEKKLNKIKQSLDKEVEIINYIENQSNIIIEQILEKINNLREIHLLKKQLYNLYLVNQENASLINTMNELGTGFTLKKEEFNTSEKLLNSLEILDTKLPEKNEINIINNIEQKVEENKKEEITKKEEEKKKQIQKLKEDKKKALKKKKEELKKLKKKKMKEMKEKKKEDNKNDNKEETKGGDAGQAPSSENSIVNDNKDLNNGNSEP